MGCTCEKSNLEEDKNEFIDILKYAPHNIDNIVGNESNTDNQNNLSSFIHTNKIESNNILSSINETELEDNKLKSNILRTINDKQKSNEEIKEMSEISTEKDEIDKFNYPETLLNIFNLIRSNPKVYASKVEYAIKYIKTEIQLVKDEATGEKKNIEKPFFKKKLKVALNKGEIVFHDAAKRLREMKSIPPLQMDNNLMINLPNNIKELYSNKYLIKQAEKVKKKSTLEIFYKDLIKDPIISALLMIVDDNENNDYKKREAILNQDYKYVGINCRYIGKTFIAYLGFSK